VVPGWIGSQAEIRAVCLAAGLRAKINWSAGVTALKRSGDLCAAPALVIRIYIL
jgi:hypothetical protein